MNDRDPRLSLGLFALAGAAAGALAGMTVGLLALRRLNTQAPEEMSETVDELKRRAEMILTELSRSPAPASHPTQSEN